MKSKRSLWILIYILAAALPSVFYILDSLNSDFLLILSGVLGITAYVLFAFQFLLTSRPKIIDKQFGLDRMYRFHMKIAVIALILAFLHKTFKEMYFSESLQTSIGEDAFIIFIAISVFSVLMMVNKLFFKFKPVDMIRKFLNKLLKIKHQYKVLIHNITLIGLMFLLVHILLAYSVSSNLPLEITLIIYFAVPFLLYFNHKIIKVYFNKSKRYTVSEVINESNNIVTVKFKPNNGKVFHYAPGQFLYIKIKNPKIPHDEHPFTISSSPAQQDYVSVTVKQLGDFTGKLNLAKVGDQAYIDGAFGTFSYIKRSMNKGNQQADASVMHKKICFIAGGIGITPFLSMLRYMDSVNYGDEVVLLWGARDLSEVVCKKELEDYSTRSKSFRLVPVLSNDKAYEGEKGFIGADLIKKYAVDFLKYDFYICGPPIMLEIQIKNLKSLGVSKKNIHFERFSI